jgi:hypothetical protein
VETPVTFTTCITQLKNGNPNAFATLYPALAPTPLASPVASPIPTPVATPVSGNKNIPGPLQGQGDVPGQPVPPVIPNQQGSDRAPSQPVIVSEPGTSNGGVLGVPGGDSSPSNSDTAPIPTQSSITSDNQGGFPVSGLFIGSLIGLALFAIVGSAFALRRAKRPTEETVSLSNAVPTGKKSRPQALHNTRKLEAGLKAPPALLAKNKKVSPVSPNKYAPSKPSALRYSYVVGGLENHDLKNSVELYENRNLVNSLYSDVNTESLPNIPLSSQFDSLERLAKQYTSTDFGSSRVFSVLSLGSDSSKKSSKNSSRHSSESNDSFVSKKSKETIGSSQRFESMITVKDEPVRDYRKKSEDENAPKGFRISFTDEPDELDDLALAAPPAPTSHVVAVGYESQLSDELQLMTGDLIGLEKIYSDGWARGQNISQGRKRGILPLAVLTPITTGPSQVLTSRGFRNKVNSFNYELGKIPPRDTSLHRLSKSSLGSGRNSGDKGRKKKPFGLSSKPDIISETVIISNKKYEKTSEILYTQQNKRFIKNVTEVLRDEYGVVQRVVLMRFNDSQEIIDQKQMVGDDARLYLQSK